MSTRKLLYGCSTLRRLKYMDFRGFNTNVTRGNSPPQAEIF